VHSYRFLIPPPVKGFVESRTVSRYGNFDEKSNEIIKASVFIIGRFSSQLSSNTPLCYLSNRDDSFFSRLFIYLFTYLFSKSDNIPWGLWHATRWYKEI